MFPTSSQNSDLVVNAALLTAADRQPRPRFLPARHRRAGGDERRRRHDAGGTVRRSTGGADRDRERRSQPGPVEPGRLQPDRPGGARPPLRRAPRRPRAGSLPLGGILERERELGTLEALGATRGQVGGLLLREGAVLIGVGVVGGVPDRGTAGLAVQRLPAGHLRGAAADAGRPLGRIGRPAGAGAGGGTRGRRPGRVAPASALARRGVARGVGSDHMRDGVTSHRGLAICTRAGRGTTSGGAT